MFQKKYNENVYLRHHPAFCYNFRSLLLLSSNAGGLYNKRDGSSMFGGLTWFGGQLSKETPKPLYGLGIRNSGSLGNRNGVIGGAFRGPFGGIGQAMGTAAVNNFWNMKSNFISGNSGRIDGMQNLEGRIGQFGIVNNLDKFAGWTGQNVVPMGSGRPDEGLGLRQVDPAERFGMMSGLGELHGAISVSHAPGAMHSGNIAMRNRFGMIGTWNEGSDVWSGLGPFRMPNRGMGMGYGIGHVGMNNGNFGFGRKMVSSTSFLNFMFFMFVYLQFCIAHSVNRAQDMFPGGHHLLRQVHMTHCTGTEPTIPCANHAMPKR